jgi:osmotically-inducible protein OsmY
MKKLSAIIAVLIAGTVLSACGPAQNGTDASKTSTTSSATKEAPVSLNGTWKDDAFEAEIADNSIVINIVSADSKSLYWKGTFPGNSGTVTSAADTEALSMSMMGSQDAEKKFKIDGDQITFEMSIAGTTKTVHLKKA